MFSPRAYAGKEAEAALDRARITVNKNTSSPMRARRHFALARARAACDRCAPTACLDRFGADRPLLERLVHAGR